MAIQRQTGTDRDAILRRVAIVLSSLPAPVAAKLLGSVPPESKQALRRTMTGLADVDPLERQRALQAFKNSVQSPHPSSSPPSQDSIVMHRYAGDRGDSFQSNGPAGGANSTASGIPGNSILKSHTLNPASPLEFIADVDDDSLVQLLDGEHPQAVALVLASIAPDQAARILSRLNAKLQSEALSRIGRLDQVPDDAANEIASHFQKRLEELNDAKSSSRGQSKLSAILAAMPPTDQRRSGTSEADSLRNAVAHPAIHSHSNDRESAPRSPSTLGSEQAAHREAASGIETSKKERSQDPTRPISDTAETTDEGEEIHRLRVAQGTRFAPVESERRGNVPSKKTSPGSGLLPSPGNEPSSPFHSTDSIHNHLLSLSPKQLCESLALVETRTAMLTLCGLPHPAAESVLSVLPRATAKQVRAQMNSLDSISIREIDEAKEIVAVASLPSSRTAVAA